jgi:hypothetical protein
MIDAAAPAPVKMARRGIGASYETEDSEEPHRQCTCKGDQEQDPFHAPQPSLDSIAMATIDRHGMAWSMLF